MIYEFVRNNTGEKIGVVLALSQYQIGWSKCHSKKDRFNKEIGLKIAYGRAMCPRISWKMPRCMELPINHIRDRARRYFKP